MGMRKGMALVGKFFQSQDTAKIAAGIWFNTSQWVIENQGERGYVIMVPKKRVKSGAEWHKISRNAAEGMIKN